MVVLVFNFEQSAKWLRAVWLWLRLGAERFAEGIDRNGCVLNVDDFEVLGFSWSVQCHTVTGARLHQRIGDGRAPTDVAAVEVYLVNAYDRDDLLVAGGVFVIDGSAEIDARGGRCGTPSSGIDDNGRVDTFRQKANSRIDLIQAPLTVEVVGVFTSVAVAGSPSDDFDDGGALATQEERVFVFESLQPGGGDVVFKWRPRWIRPWPSERPLFSHLPICHGILCVCVDQWRKLARLKPDDNR